MSRDDAAFSSNCVVHPDIYRLAGFLGTRFGANTIIDIGYGSAPNVMAPRGLHDRDNSIAEWRQAFPQGRWIDIDFENGVALDIEENILARSIVICANVIQRTADPKRLLGLLSKLCASSLAAIITAPDQNRAGNWAMKEFEALLANHGMTPTFIGLTVNAALEKNTILAIVDHCPLESGRSVPEDFRPMALVQTYNDIDIAPQTIAKLLDDGIDVYACDNWSSDETFEALSAIADARPGLTLRRFPEAGPGQYHDLAGLLQWKQGVAAKHPGRWIISFDSDEIRCSPWADISFRGGFYIAERMGFNAVDFTVLDFRPVSDGFSVGVDPEAFFRNFEFGKRPGHFFQAKAWRQGVNPVGLVESGGHDVRFPGRRPFPYKFLFKHYPLRSTEQARRKVFADRRPRYPPHGRARGWHTQYDHWKSDDSFLWHPATLIEFNERTRSDFLVELISGIGIVRP